MPYFTAVLDRSGDDWQLRPSDLETPADLDELAEAVRAATRGRGGLAIVEREDEWFALVRVDGEEDPRVFVSDLPAARQSSFATLFDDVEELPMVTTGSGGAPAPVELTGTAAAAGREVADVVADVDLGDDFDDQLQDEDEDEDEESLVGLGGLGGTGVEADAVPAHVGESDGESDGESGDGSDVARPAATESAAIGSGAATPALVSAGADSVGDATVWGGELTIVEDFGLSSAALQEIVERTGSDPAAALQAIGQEVGFADVLDSWR